MRCAGLSNSPCFCSDGWVFLRAQTRVSLCTLHNMIKRGVGPTLDRACRAPGDEDANKQDVAN